MTYEDFFTPEEVATYKRVKLGAMRLAEVGRAVAAEFVGAPPPATKRGEGKAFLRTSEGVFRLAMSHNSDNSTEQMAHEDMGAQVVVMGDDREMADFFSLHGLPGKEAVTLYKQIIRKRLAT